MVHADQGQALGRAEQGQEAEGGWRCSGRWIAETPLRFYGPARPVSWNPEFLFHESPLGDAGHDANVIKTSLVVFHSCLVKICSGKYQNQ